MNSNNVISFGKTTKPSEEKKDVDKDLLSLKSSYCDEMSNEIFGIVIEGIEKDSTAISTTITNGFIDFIALPLNLLGPPKLGIYYHIIRYIVLPLAYTNHHT